MAGAQDATPNDTTALVLFSGGQDSATCLAWALQQGWRVQTVGFDYGQRHRIELDCRSTVLTALRAQFPDWSARLGEDHLIDLNVIGQISDSALTQDREIALRADGLPNTFVPGRNLLFFTVAAALAYRRDIRHLVGGMCETDYSGYPDCRDDTLKALQATLNLGMNSRLVIDTPLMRLDKAATWRLAERLGGAKLVEILRRDTHSCYRGERGTLHDWGYGCAACPACDLRRTGYAQFVAGRGMSGARAKAIKLGLKLGLAPGHAATLARLSTPERVQDFISGLKTNFERDGATCLSVAGVLRAGHAHCIEAAYVAACALWVNGDAPLLMDFQAQGDDDHVVALFRRRGCWGAISKSNHVWLRWRDPVYRSLRELAMSYFHEYVMADRKTLRRYSRAIDLRRFKARDWITNDDNCWHVGAAIDDARHYALLTPAQARTLRRRDAMELRAGALVETTAPNKKLAAKY